MRRSKTQRSCFDYLTHDELIALDAEYTNFCAGFDETAFAARVADLTIEPDFPRGTKIGDGDGHLTDDAFLDWPIREIALFESGIRLKDEAHRGAGAGEKAHRYDDHQRREEDARRESSDRRHDEPGAK